MERSWLLRLLTQAEVEATGLTAIRIVFTELPSSHVSLPVRVYTGPPGTKVSAKVR